MTALARRSGSVSGLVNQTVHLAAGLLAGLLLLIGAALFVRQGDDPYQVLAAVAQYAPGNPVPAHVTCRWAWEYPGDSGEMCPFDALPHCQRGYLIVRDNHITYLRLYDCDLTAADLVAQYGRAQQVRLYRHRVLLVWNEVQAHGRRVGWFTLMQPISSVGWWQQRP
jgi:hypothetical protein